MLLQGLELREMRSLSCLVRDSAPILRACLCQSRYERQKRDETKKKIYTWRKKLLSFIVTITNRDFCGLWVWDRGGHSKKNKFRELRVTVRQ